MDNIDMFWACVRDKFPEASSYKVDKEGPDSSYQFTIYFAAGYSQMIYVPEEIISNIVEDVAPADRLLNAYIKDNSIIEMLMSKYVDYCALGYRMIGDSGEWVAQINFSSGLRKYVEGHDTEIDYEHQARKINSTKSIETGLREDLSEFVRDPVIVRDRMLINSKYGDGIDDLFMSREG